MIEKIIFSGLLATAVMTLFMNSSALLLKKDLYVVRILAKLLQRENRRSRLKFNFPYWVLAIIIHYITGTLFALVCLKIFSGNPSSDWWIWGLCLGVVAVISWGIFQNLRRGSTTDVPWPVFYVLIFFGHILFALVLYLGYYKL